MKSVEQKGGDLFFFISLRKNQKQKEKKKRKEEKKMRKFDQKKRNDFVRKQEVGKYKKT